MAPNFSLIASYLVPLSNLPQTLLLYFPIGFMIKTDLASIYSTSCATQKHIISLTETALLKFCTEGSLAWASNDWFIVNHWHVL